MCIKVSWIGVEFVEEVKLVIGFLFDWLVDWLCMVRYMEYLFMLFVVLDGVFYDRWVFFVFCGGIERKLILNWCERVVNWF